jgi:predicted MFS family arabinose efflux permease
MTTTPSPARGLGYQIALVSLLSLNFGIVFFDRNALNFLMVFVQPELGLNNTQAGAFQSVLSLSWACAAFGIGIVSDRTGSRKGLLILATLAFSACSFLSGLAGSFMTMLGARLLMGAAEGGVMPISQALVAAEVKPGWRGLAMGVTQNLGSNFLGSFVAPVALFTLAETVGWRQTFFITGVPGLICALLMWFVLRDPAEPVKRETRTLTFRAALAERNVLICAVMGVLLVSYLVVCWLFMPLYLIKERQFSPDTTKWLMGALGLSATVGAFLISGLSDRIGRRPLMILMPLIGVILPLGAIYFHGNVWGLAAIFFVGWGLNGIFPLFMATVPSESVDPAHTATVLGVCMGIPEVLGGVLSPTLAGYAADSYGQVAPLWIMLGLALAAGILAFGLRETAPRVLARTQASADATTRAHPAMRS